MRMSFIVWVVAAVAVVEMWLWVCGNQWFWDQSHYSCISQEFPIQYQRTMQIAPNLYQLLIAENATRIDSARPSLKQAGQNDPLRSALRRRAI